MLKRIVLALGVLMISLTMPATVAADLGNNPNVFHAEDLECDNGLESDHLLIVGRTGHVPPGSTGVATKVEAEVAPGVWVTFFEVPGVGLNKLTTECTWTGDGLNFRGDIILRGNLR